MISSEVALHELSIADMIHGLRERQFCAQELTKAFLRRIQTHNETLNAFITVTEEQALDAAVKADAKLASGGEVPTLCGIPIAVKDIFCTDGILTTCGSKMLGNFVAPYDATLVTKLHDQGAVCLGKTNMDEFAMGSSNENSFYSAVKNPWDLNCVPGGSSGGSSAAVAGRLAPLALGTDTGGSIRQPAAFCGITGLKPTYGRVSRFGMIAFASSLDQAGPMAASAEDCAYLLAAIAGHDEKDSTSVNQPLDDYVGHLNDSLEGLTIGIPEEYFSSDLNPEIQKACQDALAEFECLGAKLKPVHLPNIKHATPAYYIVAPAEASSNLARYDGVRFGHRAAGPKNLEDLYMRSRDEGFGPEVKRRILTGTYVLSSGYFDAYYIQAQKVRQLISNDFKQAFSEVDLIAAPATPSPAFRIGERTDDLIEMYYSDIFTVPVNLAGLPAIAMPVGFSNQLPLGMQLIGNYFSEARLLNATHRYQQQTDWHAQTPKGFNE